MGRVHPMPKKFDQTQSAKHPGEDSLQIALKKLMQQSAAIDERMKSPTRKSLLFKFSWFRVAGILTAILLASLSLRGLKMVKQIPQAAASALFEIRVLQKSGHPVAGATVGIGNKLYGVTDSFGEWRKYLLVKPGSNLLVKVTKTQQNQTQTITKSVAVPLESENTPSANGKKQISIVTSIELDTQEPISQTSPPATADIETKKQKQAELAETKENTCDQSISVSKPTHPHATSQGTALRKASILEEHVVPFIRAEISNRSAFQNFCPTIRLSHLTAKEGPGLIRTSATFVNIKKPSESFSFEWLQNYTGQAQGTATSLVVGMEKLLAKRELAATTTQVNKQNSQIIIPDEWRGAEKKVFVSGYPVVPDQDGKLVWNPKTMSDHSVLQTMGNPILSVVVGDHIVFRSPLAQSGSHWIPSLKATSRVAKR